MAAGVNIEKSIISISSPGIFLQPGDHKIARQLCRDCNDYAAGLKKRDPDHFGFWATLPLPDIEGSLSELAHALDTLNADGIAVETNHHGKYLGDESFEPVWAELDRRKAIVFIHPTCPWIAENAHITHPSQRSPSSTKDAPTPAVPLPTYPRPIFEFLFDTARAVINLFYTGTITRYPNITYIIPHSGGCLIPLIQRFSLFGHMIPGLPVEPTCTPDFVKDRLRKQFYFDLAGTPYPDAVYALMRHVDVRQVLYGSDYPFTPAGQVKVLAGVMAQGMGKGDLFRTEEDKEAVYYGNAKRLLEARGTGSGL